MVDRLNLKIGKADAYLLLNGLSGIGPISARNLLDYFEDDPTAIFRAKKSNLLRVKGIGEKIIHSLMDSRNHDWLIAENNKIKSRAVSFVSQNKLPSLLLEIYDPPIGLYVSGELPDRPYVGIVGTASSLQNSYGNL